MPLLMPFYFDYDSLLLVVAIVVYAAGRDFSATHWEDRAVVGLWIATFLTTTLYTPMLAIVSAFIPKQSALNPLFTAIKIHFNPVIPLLFLTAAMLIRRALRPSKNVPSILRPPESPFISPTRAFEIRAA
jgi:low temperature requirement protein LtrA